MFCLQTHLHADFESLYKEVPKRILPEEYGGEAGTIEDLTGEGGVGFFCLFEFVIKSKELSLHTNTQLTQARPTVYVAYFDIETQGALKPHLSLNIFKSRV